MSEQDRSSRTDTEWKNDTRWGHKKLGGPWWLALLLVPLLLAALATAVHGDDLEADLQKRTLSALEGKGISGAKVEFDGRDGEVTLPKKLPAGTDAAGVESLVSDVDGVRTAEVSGGAAAGDDTKKEGEKPAGSKGACADLQTKIDAVLGGNRVAFGSRSADLEGAEAAQVAEAAELLKGCDTSASVVGHTADQRPTVNPLSQKRADAVAAALEDAGVTVVSAEGIGNTEPLSDDDSPAGRALNRSTEIKVA